jgi:predicted PolB exonuclease-like 3'-5' exonuclease
VSKSFLVLDIETILDPELPIAGPAESERLPAAPHHEVVALGVLWLDRGYEPKRIGLAGETKDESGILRDFARTFEEQRPRLVTFNGRGFDLPVIAMRCLRHGIPLRQYYRDRTVRSRYTPKGHLDLMDYLADFGASKPSRLDIISKVCGMPGKLAVNGKDVAGLVAAGRSEEVRNYCLCDVAQTAGVFLRVQLLRGKLRRDAYLGAMRGLIALIKADARLRPVASAMNEARLLLHEEEGV